MNERLVHIQEPDQLSVFMHLACLQTAIAVARAPSWPEGGSVADGLGGAVSAARGSAPPEQVLARLRLRDPAGGELSGRDVVARLERACSRAAGVIEPEGYPLNVPAFVVRRLHPHVLYGRNPLFVAEIVCVWTNVALT